MNCLPRGCNSPCLLQRAAVRVLNRKRLHCSRCLRDAGWYHYGSVSEGRPTPSFVWWGGQHPPRVWGILQGDQPRPCSEGRGPGFHEETKTWGYVEGLVVGLGPLSHHQLCLGQEVASGSLWGYERLHTDLRPRGTQGFAERTPATPWSP